MSKIIILIGNIRFILRKNTENNIPAIAAHSAFFIILSFVPFLIFALAIFAEFGIKQTDFEELVKGVLIDESMKEWVKSILQESYSAATGVAVTTLIIALWSAGKGVYSITEGIRVIYKLPNRYNWFVKRLFSMGYTLFMFIAIVVALGGLVFTEFMDSYIRPLLKGMHYIIFLIYTLRYLVAFALIVVLIAAALKMYLRRRVTDKKYSSFKVQLPGAVITAGGWVLLSLGIRIYVNYFNGFSIYGSLGTLALVMVWIYLSIYIFAFGIQINCIYCNDFYEFRLSKLFKRKS